MNVKNHVKWFDEIRNQFIYGGKKYAKTSTKESTDVLFDTFGQNWLYGTLGKYCFRYSNVGREKDLLKIATYCFIIWLKRGFHLKEEGTKEVINTTVNIKSKYFGKFEQRVFDFMGDYNTIGLLNPIETIYDILSIIFANIPFQDIKEERLFEIFALCYYTWERDIPDNQKGKDQDVYHPKDRK